MEKQHISRSVTLSFSVILTFAVLFTLSSVSHAGDRTQTMKYVRYCDDGYTYNGIKVMLQSYDTGNRYFVWYKDPIGTEEGQDVVITFESDDWETITNLDNGKESGITKVLKVE